MGARRLRGWRCHRRGRRDELAGCVHGPPGALASAASGDEIWIAAGVYRPTAIADRAASFYLPAGVAVYGGFGGTEVARSDRDPVRFPVRLTGEIGAPGPTDNSLAAEFRGYRYAAASLGPVFPTVVAFPGLGYGAAVAGADFGP